MGRIEPETVRRIIETANIVDVVSDFVALKRRGANYVGLCPFHNERTPSFSVNKARNYCKCFSCGQGGSPVGFIMLHEQMTYPEALRYLAKKYHIEIKEEELSEEQIESERERESILNINKWAMERFETWMTSTDEGRNVGLAYFRQRGLNDEIIKRFHLGYALNARDTMAKEALEQGFSPDIIVKSGIGARREGSAALFDRFRERVIFPVFTLSGQVVAFGGRILTSDKKFAKYVNSPENAAYSKSNEIFGLYQAKRGIMKRDKCILVEGYMDVISMHQRGMDNVVASSGTALTFGQIRKIHNLTENVTVIYDADAAGIKAALRSVDMLLSEGLKIKIVLLPDGKDPDEYAQRHTSEEVEKCIEENETDFIRFKIRMLLGEAGDDPIKRASVISDISRSISVIPDDILRMTYIQDSARILECDERTMATHVARLRAEAAKQRAEESQREREREKLRELEAEAAPPSAEAQPAQPEAPDPHAADLRDVERELIRYVVRYAMVSCFEQESDCESDLGPMTVAEYIASELEYDGIRLANPDCRRILERALELRDEYRRARAEAEAKATSREAEEYRLGVERIRRDLADQGIGAMERAEADLRERLVGQRAEILDTFDTHYVEHLLLSDPDDAIRNTSTDLAAERHQLSKIHTKYSHVESERERLPALVPRAVYELKYAILEIRQREMVGEMAARRDDPEAQTRLMQEIVALSEVRKDLARYLGERTLSARRR